MYIYIYILRYSCTHMLIYSYAHILIYSCTYTHIDIYSLMGYAFCDLFNAGAVGMAHELPKECVDTKGFLR